MTELDEQGRPEPPLAAGEAATLIGFLDFQRATLAWKCAGLDSSGLSTPAAASSMTLGGIIAAVSTSLPSGPGRTAGHRACAGSCAT